MGSLSGEVQTIKSDNSWTFGPKDNNSMYYHIISYSHELQFIWYTCVIECDHQSSKKSYISLVHCHILKGVLNILSTPIYMHEGDGI